MRMDIYTIFPAIFASPLQEGLLGKAIDTGILDIRVHDIRDHAEGKHHQVDDAPFGGGPGMVIKPEPVFEAVTRTLGYGMDELDALKKEVRIFMLTPRGGCMTQAKVEEMAALDHIALICGRYEGVDQRVIDLAVDEEISIGDFVLSGGEIPAMAVIEAVSRLVPGVLGNPRSVERESFQDGRLEGPQYTRPAEYRGRAVPEVLRSGDHGEIERWRRERALEKTKRRRPDLLTARGEE